MDTLRPQILQYLSLMSEPVTAHAVAEAIATSADTNEVRNYLRKWIQQGKVERHHSSDGLLRYSLIGAASRPAPVLPPEPMPALEPPPATAPVPAAASVMEPAKSVPLGGLQAHMLSMLSATPVTARRLIKQGPFSERQISNLLQRLQGKGLVTKHRNGRDFTWSLASGVTAPAAVPASTLRCKPLPIGKPVTDQPDRKRDMPSSSEAVQRVLKALECTHVTASEALELYVASVADPTIFAALKRSVCDAQAALDAYSAAEYARWAAQRAGATP